MIERSIEENGYTNIRVVEGTVGEEVTLSDYPPADVALMDVDGAESELVECQFETIQSVPHWIVELHELQLPSVLDTADPELVENKLRNAGYGVNQLGARRDGNYHIKSKR